jgi:hypothetical protein
VFCLTHAERVLHLQGAHLLCIQLHARAQGKVPPHLVVVLYLQRRQLPVQVLDAVAAGAQRFLAVCSAHARLYRRCQPLRARPRWPAALLDQLLHSSAWEEPYSLTSAATAVGSAATVVTGLFGAFLVKFPNVVHCFQVQARQTVPTLAPASLAPDVQRRKLDQLGPRHTKCCSDLNPLSSVSLL